MSVAKAQLSAPAGGFGSRGAAARCAGPRAHGLQASGGNAAAAAIAASTAVAPANPRRHGLASDQGTQRNAEEQGAVVPRQHGRATRREFAASRACCAGKNSCAATDASDQHRPRSQFAPRRSPASARQTARPNRLATMYGRPRTGQRQGRRSAFPPCGDAVTGMMARATGRTNPAPARPDPEIGVHRHRVRSPTTRSAPAGGGIVQASGVGAPTRGLVRRPLGRPDKLVAPRRSARLNADRAPNTASASRHEAAISAPAGAPIDSDNNRPETAIAIQVARRAAGAPSPTPARAAA